MVSKNKNKDKISFEKRRFQTAPLSKLLPSMIHTMGKQSQKTQSSVSIIRILTHWNDIVGQEMVSHTQPIKVFYRKQKNRNTGELETIISLKIIADSAFGTIIAMRQNIILERLNRLFGTTKFQKLSIDIGKISRKSNLMIHPEPKHYDLNLPDIEDAVLKSRLESLGQAVMNSTQK
jgi:hypothetical protein